MEEAIGRAERVNGRIKPIIAPTRMPRRVDNLFI
jgi:hypothetical protein